ncbi:hypothetical protein [uncultured Mediterranean phage]|nr:hypothetical protein [uncultured Mediterranean phage]
MTCSFCGHRGHIRRHLKPTGGRTKQCLKDRALSNIREQGNLLDPTQTTHPKRSVSKSLRIKRLKRPSPAKQATDPSEKDILKELAKSWNEAITKSDQHYKSKKCKGCNRKWSKEPTYRFCVKAKRLYRNEVNAQKAYLKVGGKLPVKSSK